MPIEVTTLMTTKGVPTKVQLYRSNLGKVVVLSIGSNNHQDIMLFSASETERLVQFITESTTQK